MKYDVITIGSATRDIFFKSAKFEVIESDKFEGGKAECFPLGAKVPVDEIAFATGGGGTNTAVTFARQGFKTACIGVIGSDLEGQNIITDLQNEGVNTSLLIKHDDDYTAYSVIIAHGSGERTILNYKGEGQHFDAAQLPLDHIDTNWLYIDSLGGKIEVLNRLVAHGTKNNIKLACNPGGRTLDHGLDALRSSLAYIDVYITNKEEGAKLLGSDASDWQYIATELKKLVKGIVSVSDGSNGVMVIDQDGKQYQAGVPDSPVVERTGAGDAFGSGFVAEYMRSDDVTKAIQAGTANASSVVTKFGGKEGILKQGDTGQWPLVDVEIN